MPDSLFYSVQNLLRKKENYTVRTKVPSIFSGMIYCSTCNHRMCRKQDNRVKTPFIRYACDYSSRKKIGTTEYKCTNTKTIREKDIERYLLDNIKEYAKNYISQNIIISNVAKPKDNSKEIKQIQNKMLKLKDLYLDDLIDKNTYKTDYEKLNKQLSELNKIIPKAKKRDFSNLQKFINLDLETIYDKLTIEEKRTLWINTIDKIIVENGEIKEITFL